MSGRGMSEKRYNELMKLINTEQFIVDTENGIVMGKRGPYKGKTSSGYISTTVQVEGKSYSFCVHDIILASVGVNLTGLTVDHINGNKTDNRLCNLEAVSQSENSRRAWKAGKINGFILHKGNPNLKNKEKIKQEYKAGKKQVEIAEKYKVSQATVSRIINDVVWGWI